MLLPELDNLRVPQILSFQKFHYIFFPRSVSNECPGIKLDFSAGAAFSFIIQQNSRCLKIMHPTDYNTYKYEYIFNKHVSTKLFINF